MGGGAGHTEIGAKEKLDISPSLSILTLGKPILALTLKCQVSGRSASAVPTFK